MRLFVVLLMLGAAGFFAWKYQESEQAKAAIEARRTEVTQKLDATTKDLYALKGVKVTADGKVQPTPKPNWIAERIRERDKAIKEDPTAMAVPPPKKSTVPQ